MNRRYPDFNTPHPRDPGHTYDTPCLVSAEYCRIHQVRTWGRYGDSPAGEAVAFPESFNYRSSRKGDPGWITVTVHCGPGAWNPKRPPKDES